MDTPLIDLDELSNHLLDLNELLKERCEGYGAVISFDFSKREVNRSDRVMTFVIVGEDLEHAIDEFKTEDSSHGLIESDFIEPVFIIQLQVTY